MKKKWEYYEINQKEKEELKKEYNIDDLLAIVLVNRGIKKEEIRKFLEPTRNDFYNPYEMPDMEKAVERILKSIENKEKIIIYGDYDVDGITSITVLESFLKERGLEVNHYIPNRLNEGYGLNKNAIEKIAKENYDLMITVDCGITGIEEIKYAKELGIETIVTDHHEPGETIPEAIGVIDCKRKDNKYPFRELAGVGVVFKLCQAIGMKLGLEQKEYLKYLDIVAIGTISDIVPLVDENRVITKLGMKLVQCTRNSGLKALINLSEYNKIDSNTISFGVAPRINACGRMGVADEALELLLSENIEDAIEKSKNIMKYNNKRQEYEKEIFLQAVEQIKEQHLENSNSIVLGGNGWHHGVIGIVASKITELYYKPCILICFEDGSDIGKGSGRSIKGFDLYKSLTKCKDIIAGFGGHSMAIGISVEKEKFKELQNVFEEITRKAAISELCPIIKIDAILNIDDVTKEMVQSLTQLEPLGEANQMPIFSFKNLKINSIRALTDGKHLKLSLKSDKNTLIDAIGFNLGELSKEYVIGDKVDVIGNLEINSFNGVEKLQINLKDMMKTV